VQDNPLSSVIGDMLTLFLVNYLAFDMMTALAFDCDLRTMEDPEYRYVIEAIEEANIRLGVISQAMELTFHHLDRRIFLKSAISGYKFVKFLRRLLRQRLERENIGSKDIFSFLQQCKDPETGEGLTHTELSTETATFVVAGKFSLLCKVQST
jgi:cytochrome P450